jgi:hypothetical protein
MGTTIRKPRMKPFEACVVNTEKDVYMVLSEHTTARAALNAMAFRAAFGAPGLVYRVRDIRTGQWVEQLSCS